MEYFRVWWKQQVWKQEWAQVISFKWPFIVGIIVLLQYAWVPGFFQDGYIYAAFGKYAAELGLWLIPHLSNHLYDEFYQHIPFIFILEGLFFKVFGSSFLTARIFIAVFTLLTGFFIYRLIKKYGDEKWAYFSAALFFIIPALIKKARFPNTDIPLMLFVLLSVYAYWNFFIKKQNWQWIVSGFFLGCALLTKGPLALMIVSGVFVHLLLTRNIGVLKTIWPWAGLLTAFLVFFIWPLSLASIGRIDVFFDYLKSIFVHTLVDARGVESNSYFAYLFFFLKQTSIWFLLSIWTTIRLVNDFYYKKREDQFLILIAGMFWINLILMSFIKFKYSQYLIPLYPFMVILAAWPLARLGGAVVRHFSFSYKLLAVIMLFFFLVFPQGKIKRDAEIFKALEISQALPKPVDSWIIVNDSYSYYNAANLLAFMNHHDTFYADRSILNDWPIDKSLLAARLSTSLTDFSNKNWGLIVRKDDWDKLGGHQRKFKKLIHFSKKDILFIIPEQTVYFSF